MGQTVHRGQIPLAEASASPRQTTPADDRKTLPVPPPVVLRSIRDVMLSTPTALLSQLRPFYVDLLNFHDYSSATETRFAAENFDLVFENIEEKFVRQRRPVGVVTPHFSTLLCAFDERKIEFIYELGVVAGDERAIVRDPVGNWLAIYPRREIR